MKKNYLRDKMLIKIMTLYIFTFFSNNIYAELNGGLKNNQQIEQKQLEEREDLDESSVYIIIVTRGEGV